MNPHLLTTVRSFIVRNTNLAQVFDELSLKVMFPSSILKMKRKADIIEAMIGEMAEAISNNIDSQITTVLQELLTFICYVGERAYFATTMGMDYARTEKLQATWQKGRKKITKRRRRRRR